MPDRSHCTQLVIALLLATTSVARADDPKLEAQIHVQRAMAHHSTGKFGEALGELQLAYKLDPQPGLLYAIAQVYVKLDRCSEALPFYERFLETHPDARAASAASEAITVCKARPPEPTPEPKPEPKPEPTPEPTPEPILLDKPASRAWYKDPIGAALVGGGVLTGVVGMIFYRSASSDLDAAETAPTYGASEDLIDGAHRKRTYAGFAAAGGIALVGVGVLRYVLASGSSDERRVAITPTPGGAAITWSGGF